MTVHRWLKSSYSSANGDCVELADTLDRIRDSKDPHGPTLGIDVAGFVRAVKDGRFDR
ncbi:DUF397 domain-containing protein [Saccharopolyspora phatthalungensis]|uniref:DUF397 domain-containing protein n=1 Tax=Saccharopolyspora phatthalungensis TaxID=664693 RepID=A0A840Q342_9PSEU|nr:DUF397 domain-containing protein [Saccharopolyspora phatthalungensis]MBB5154914.1 hypothetical protein [Saccharopolyspora phatthalungensis]